MTDARADNRQARSRGFEHRNTGPFVQRPLHVEIRIGEDRRESIVRYEAQEPHTVADAFVQRVLLELAAKRVFAQQVEARIDGVPDDGQHIEMMRVP